MRKWTLSLSLGLLALLILATPAFAGRSWCMRDPIVRLNGHDAQLLVGIPVEYQSLVTGAINVQIFVPAGVSTETLFLDAGFNGYGEKVTYGTLTTGKVYADGSFDVQVRVTLPINTKKVKSIPLQLTMNVGGAAMEASADTWAYSGGTTYIVEMNNNGAVISGRYPATAVYATS